MQSSIKCVLAEAEMNGRHPLVGRPFEDRLLTAFASPSPAAQRLPKGGAGHDLHDDSHHRRCLFSPCFPLFRSFLSSSAALSSDRWLRTNQWITSPAVQLASAGPRPRASSSVSLSFDGRHRAPPSLVSWAFAIARCGGGVERREPRLAYLFPLRLFRDFYVGFHVLSLFPSFFFYRDPPKLPMSTLCRFVFVFSLSGRPLPTLSFSFATPPQSHICPLASLPHGASLLASSVALFVNSPRTPHVPPPTIAASLPICLIFSPPLFPAACAGLTDSGYGNPLHSFPTTPHRRPAHCPGFASFPHLLPFFFFFTRVPTPPVGPRASLSHVYCHRSPRLSSCPLLSRPLHLSHFSLSPKVDVLQGCYSPCCRRFEHFVPPQREKTATEWPLAKH